MAEDEATISIPSLAIVAVLGFFIYRYFFSSRNGNASSNSGATSSSRIAGQRFTPAQVDQISAMFPQLSRRDIMWDLHRNRGSVQATTERVLMGRGLDPAPPSFQPPPIFNVPPLSAMSNSMNPNTSLPSKAGPDLITRYNLQSRISDKGKEREEDPVPMSVRSGSPGGNKTAWTTSKEQRQQMLQRRRDEMILAARRKMQEKDSAVSSPSPVPMTAVQPTESLS